MKITNNYKIDIVMNYKVVKLLLFVFLRKGKQTFIKLFEKPDFNKLWQNPQVHDPHPE